MKMPWEIAEIASKPPVKPPAAKPYRFARTKRRTPSGLLRSLFEATQGKCSYCSRTTHMPTGMMQGLAASIDHAVPISRGGSRRGDNCVLACCDCNTRKADMVPDEWAAFMKENPRWWLKIKRRRAAAPIKPYDFARLYTYLDQPRP